MTILSVYSSCASRKLKCFWLSTQTTKLWIVGIIMSETSKWWEFRWDIQVVLTLNLSADEFRHKLRPNINDAQFYHENRFHDQKWRKNVQNGRFYVNRLVRGHVTTWHPSGPTRGGSAPRKAKLPPRQINRTIRCRLQNSHGDDIDDGGRLAGTKEATVISAPGKYN